MHKEAEETNVPIFLSSNALISITTPYLGQTQQEAKEIKKDGEWMGWGDSIIKENSQFSCMCLVYSARCMDINGYYFYFQNSDVKF